MSLFLQSESVGRNHSWLAMALGKAATLVAGDVPPRADPAPPPGPVWNPKAGFGDPIPPQGIFQSPSAVRAEASAQAAELRRAAQKSQPGWGRLHA